MSILDHSWGESREADAIWLPYTGMHPDLLARLSIMVLQAYVDDSADDRSGAYVLAGYIAKPESWAKLSAEWAEELPNAVRHKDGGFHFKMARMAQFPDTMQRVERFYRIIERHALMAISVSANKKEVARAKNRIHVPGLSINWGNVTNNFMVLYRGLMDEFHASDKHEFDKVIDRLNNEIIDFIFDDQTEKKFVWRNWEGYTKALEVRGSRKFGRKPDFHNDREYVALQAADLWAWWVRRWIRDGVRQERMKDLDFGQWRAQRMDLPRIHISLPEDGLVKIFTSMIREQIEPGRPIYDVRFGF